MRIKNFKKKDLELFTIISNISDKLGVQSYVVGGYVRDLLLDLPNDDIDIVVIGKGIQLAQEFGKKVGSGVQVFRNFGTAKVNWSDLEVEFVGARKESYDRGSRKPIVEDGTLEDDLTRRDFTINAMAISLGKNNFGELIDLFGGLDHLDSKTIKTPTDPNITFSDDPLRMLRCIRFATRLGFSINKETFDAIKENRTRLEIISAERISGELNKILMSFDPKRGIDLLMNSGLLELILPELSILNDSGGEGIEHHKNNYWHSTVVLENVAKRSDNIWLRWAALLHDIGKEPCKRFIDGVGWTFHNHEYIGTAMVEKIFRRLKLPLDDKLDYVKKMVNLHMRPSLISTEEITDSAVRRLLFDAGDDFEDLMILCESDLTTKNDAKKKRILDHFVQLRNMVDDLRAKDYKRLFQPCLNGNDIMNLLKINKGRNIGILKNFIKDAVLDGRVDNTKESLTKLLFDKAAELGIIGQTS